LNDLGEESVKVFQGWERDEEQLASRHWVAIDNSSKSQIPFPSRNQELETLLANRDGRRPFDGWNAFGIGHAVSMLDAGYSAFSLE